MKSATPSLLPATEASTTRKVRAHLLPLLFVLYIVAFLDRINIGFAALTMNRELAITSQQFGLVVGIFFFGYFLLEVPSNLLLHRLGARVWLARILVTWGVVAALTGFVHTAAQLYIARFLLGLAEAGFFPGLLLYLSYWFRQREQARAIALCILAQPVTNILGAPISGLILDHVHWLGLSSWRWLLILEGLPAIVGGVVAYALLPSRPRDAKFLTTAELDWLTAELAREAQHKPGREFSPSTTLIHPRVWHLALVGFTQAIGAYTLVFWMPQQVKALSQRFSNTTIGLLVMIPYLAGLLAMIVVARNSDRTLERKFHTAIPLSVAAVALLLLSRVHSAFGSIALLSMAAAGVYGFFGPYFSLPGQFLSGASAASGIALITSVANLGGFVGPFAVGFISRRTGNLHAGVALAGLSLLVSSALISVLPARSERSPKTGTGT